MKCHEPRCGWRLPTCAAIVAWIAVDGVVPCAAAQTETRATFAIDYIVAIRADEPGVALVRWEISGAEELNALEFTLAEGRMSALESSGELAPLNGGRIRWTPRGPYGHLEYKMRIDHRRDGGEGFDSYAGNAWVVARARDLFPRIKVDYTRRRDGSPPRSRARLIFRLPQGWQSVTAHPAAGPFTYTLATGSVLSRPSGWIALGRLELVHQEIDDVMVRIARAPGSNLSVEEVYALLGDAMPRLRKMFRTMPLELLIVSAGDPMWRGGLSAYHSVFLHGDRPLRTADKTAPVLHELFHVAQPFRGGADADWIVEGLAEYYSLELQRRAGVLTAKGFAKGLDFFARYGLWNVDLTRQHDNAATNNSAPLVMYALDQRIQRETAGKKRLDDVVALVAENRRLDTAGFRAAVEKTTGKRLSKFFAQHVERGEMPRLDPAG